MDPNTDLEVTTTIPVPGYVWDTVTNKVVVVERVHGVDDSLMVMRGGGTRSRKHLRAIKEEERRKHKVPDSLSSTEEDESEHSDDSRPESPMTWAPLTNVKPLTLGMQRRLSQALVAAGLNTQGPNYFLFAERVAKLYMSSHDLENEDLHAERDSITYEAVQVGLYLHIRTDYVCTSARTILAHPHGL